MSWDVAFDEPIDLPNGKEAISLRAIMKDAEPRFGPAARGVLAFKMRPAATALTTRVTRTTPICSSTLHFGKDRRMCAVGMRAVFGECGGLFPCDTINAA
jgi:hypothetical protein